MPSLPTTTAGYVKYAITDEPNYYKTQLVSGTNNTPATNPISDAGATLGRVLFYDKRLSHDNSGSGLGNASVPEPTGLALAIAVAICGLSSRRLARRAAYHNVDSSGRQ